MNTVEKTSIDTKEIQNAFRVIDIISFENRLSAIYTFESFIQLDLHETKTSLRAELAGFVKDFDLFGISIYDDVVYDLNEANRLEQMTNKEIIQEIIFRLI